MSEEIQRKLDSIDALNNMLLLCGEPELDGLNEPAARLRALIDGLITQRNRADAAEAEIARLKAEMRKIGMDVGLLVVDAGAYAKADRDMNQDFNRFSKLANDALQISSRALSEHSAQPPAVGEDE